MSIEISLSQTLRGEGLTSSRFVLTISVFSSGCLLYIWVCYRPILNSWPQGVDDHLMTWTAHRSTSKQKAVLGRSVPKKQPKTHHRHQHRHPHRHHHQLHHRHHLCVAVAVVTVADALVAARGSVAITLASTLFPHPVHLAQKIVIRVVLPDCC